MILLLLSLCQSCRQISVAARHCRGGRHKSTSTSPNAPYQTKSNIQHNNNDKKIKKIGPSGFPKRRRDNNIEHSFFITPCEKPNAPSIWWNANVCGQSYSCLLYTSTFHTSPCTETVNDVLTAVLGEVGFESLVESEGGLTAYIQQSVCDENAIKTVIAEFPLSDTEITYTFTRCV